jgi:hypothetical protein
MVSFHRKEAGEGLMPRRKSKGGRPTKVNAPIEVETRDREGRVVKTRTTVAKAICDAVAQGVPPTAAAEAAGIPRETLSRWKQRGKAKPSSTYGRFVTELKQSRALAHSRLARAFYIQAFKDPKAAQFWFTRREKKTWAEPTKDVRVSGKEGAPPVALSVATDPAVQKMLERFRKMDAERLLEEGAAHG